jgi:hypothetical protein
MLGEQFGFERVGMVEVDFDTLGRGQPAQILVISIVLKERYPVWTDAL